MELVYLTHLGELCVIVKIKSNRDPVWIVQICGLQKKIGHETHRLLMNGMTLLGEL
jgi:hypothetical protein